MLQQPRSQEETPCTRTQEVSWETLLNKRRKPKKSFALFFKRNTFTTKKDLAHKWVLKP
jgi:hypothetical protein